MPAPPAVEVEPVPDNEPDIRVLANDVGHLQTDLADFQRDQGDQWKLNRETHKDLYSKLDRLPVWATLLIAALTGVASGVSVALIKG